MPDNLLTHKLGPLPTWGWMGIGTVGVGGVYLYMKHKGGTAATTATPTQSDSSTPDFVFQNYNELPPSAAPPTTTTPPPTTQPAPGSTPTHIVPPPPPHIGAGNAPANPGTHIYTSNGKMTLAQVAKAHKTTPAAIVATTGKNKNNVSKTLAAYFKRANWNEPIPKGTTIVYTDG